MHQGTMDKFLVRRSATTNEVLPRIRHARILRITLEGTEEPLWHDKSSGQGPAHSTAALVAAQLATWFNRHPRHLRRFQQVISGTCMPSSFSLRLVDYALNAYIKDQTSLEATAVRRSYHEHMIAYARPNFDMFRRNTVVGNMCVLHMNNGQRVATALAQMRFFRWAFEYGQGFVPLESASIVRVRAHKTRRKRLRQRRVLSEHAHEHTNEHGHEHEPIVWMPPKSFTIVVQ